MSSVKVPEQDLREVDICDEESGVLENSLRVSAENRVGLHDERSRDLQPHSEHALSSLAPKRCLGSDGAGRSVCLETLCHEAWTRCDGDDGRSVCRSSIVDCLLVELYDTYSSGKGLRSADSLDSSTEASGSDAFLGRSNTASSFLQELQEKHTKRHQRNYLSQKGLFLGFVQACHKWKLCKIGCTTHTQVFQEFYKSFLSFLNRFFLVPFLIEQHNPGSKLTLVQCPFWVAISINVVPMLGQH